MSRTYKDKHWKLRFPESYTNFDAFYDRVPYEANRYRFCPELGKYVPSGATYTAYIFMEKAGVKTKKRKSLDNKWHWTGATPSAWTRLMMNRPQRRKGRVWERTVLFQDLHEADPPGVSRKPHVYYH